MQRMLLALALVAVMGGRARAQGDDDAAAARAAFVDGTAEFNLGHWQNAIAAWERGYKLKPDPVFLYNIGQAYRLADIPDKAIFFYRGYLRVAPDASNRAEVEQRLAQLEKVTAERRAVRDAPPQEPLPTPAPAVAAPAHPRRLDLELGIGVSIWAAGVPAGTQPGLMAQGGAGYTALSAGRLELRIGGLITYTFLHDVSSYDHFVSILIDPILRVRLFRERLYFDAELGLGAQLIAGLSGGSPLLAAGAAGKLLAAFALRPALGLEARLTAPFALRLWVAAAYSPITGETFARSTLLGIELGVGAVLRL